MRTLPLAVAAALVALPAFAANAPATPPGEQPVAPYEQSDANAGATPITDPAVFKAFHGEAGVDRIVTEAQRLYEADPRISDIFKAADKVRLHRLLVEQICYILGGPCHYSGMDMVAAHKDMG
ncbi:MAG: group 1 hemoglobin, partial [Caulobacteraceae bacterium]|nr:group 1 hemoglobin [Caulobacteraceae bacterium]